MELTTDEMRVWDWIAGTLYERAVLDDTPPAEIAAAAAGMADAFIAERRHRKCPPLADPELKSAFDVVLKKLVTPK